MSRVAMPRATREEMERLASAETFAGLQGQAHPAQGSAAAAQKAQSNEIWSGGALGGGKIVSLARAVVRKAAEVEGREGTAFEPNLLCPFHPPAAA